jgi:pimeloyl-ACP methyl ester carboxylesterase
MEDRLVNIRGLFTCTGCNILMVEYRGYGTSEGEPSEDGLKLDAQAALDYLHDARDDVDGRQIFAFGRSLGGAVAIWLAHKNPRRLRGIMIENSFTSIREMAMPIFPFLQFIRACALLVQLQATYDLLAHHLHTMPA